jgi:hypothetical protein
LVTCDLLQVTDYSTHPKYSETVNLTLSSTIKSITLVQRWIDR